MGHGRAILALDVANQTKVARMFVKQGLSVRATEQLVKGLKDKGAKSKGSKKTSTSRLDPNLRSLQEDLSERLGAEVSIKQGKGGKGRLEINYNSLDELDGILSRIK